MEAPFKLEIKAALNHDESNEYFISDANGFHLAKVYNSNGQFDESYQEAQARHVLKSVNNFEALRDALETLMLYADNCESHPEYLKLLKASE
jgi:hypothetical protein